MYVNNVRNMSIIVFSKRKLLGLFNISLELEWHNEFWCYVKLAFNPLSFMTLGLALNILLNIPEFQILHL